MSENRSSRQEDCHGCGDDGADDSDPRLLANATRFLGMDAVGFTAEHVAGFAAVLVL
ncbi:MAG: hypothetical protein QOH05_2951, partial [Acetobacteraceae bacterium]|nr:hypothetical protein [Acetobacteraceae bacterium]